MTNDHAKPVSNRDSETSPPLPLGLPLLATPGDLVEVPHGPVTEGEFVTLKPARTRSTPLERYIRDQTEPQDRRRKYDEEQAKAGIIRVTVRCHVDDADRVKKYVARLLRNRIE